MAQREGNSPLFQQLHRVQEGPELHPGIVPAVPGALVGAGEVGENAGAGKPGQRAHPRDLLGGARLMAVLGEKADAAHARVDLHMAVDHGLLFDRGAGKLPRILLRIDRLGDAQLRQGMRHLGRRAAQDQNRAGDLLPAQGDRLVDIGNREPVGALLLERAGDIAVPVAVGVRLDHRHRAAAGRQAAFELAVVVYDAVQVDVRPGAAQVVHGLIPRHSSAFLSLTMSIARPAVFTTIESPSVMRAHTEFVLNKRSRATNNMITPAASIRAPIFRTLIAFLSFIPRLGRRVVPSL